MYQKMLKPSTNVVPQSSEVNPYLHSYFLMLGGCIGRKYAVYNKQLFAFWVALFGLDGAIDYGFPFQVCLCGVCSTTAEVQGPVQQEATQESWTG